MKEELLNLGLTEKEITIYTTCLKIGSSSVANIIRHADIARPTTYDILESLVTKGLISIHIKDKKRHYSAAEPEVILAQIKDKERIAQSILPELKSLQGSITANPSTTVYQGFVGVSSLLAKIYSGEDLFIIGSASKAMTALKHIPEQYARLRVEKKIPMKAILEKSDAALFRVRDPEINKFTEIKFIDEMKHYPALTFIYGKAAAMVTVENELIGVEIQDKNIAAAQKMLFNFVWERAEE